MKVYNNYTAIALSFIPFSFNVLVILKPLSHTEWFIVPNNYFLLTVERQKHLSKHFIMTSELLFKWDPGLSLNSGHSDDDSIKRPMTK